MNDQGKHTDSNSPSPSQPQAGSSQNMNTDGLKQQGRDTAHEIGEVAQHQAESYYTQQRDNAAEQTHKLTSVFHKMADEFDQQQQPFFSQQARKFADSTDRFSHNLRGKDLQSVCNDAKNFSRREPALFIGGVIAAGFLASRFLRSSSQRTSGQYSSSSDNAASGVPGSPFQGASVTDQPGSTAQNPSYSQPAGVTEGPAYGSAGINQPDNDGRR